MAPASSATFMQAQLLIEGGTKLTCWLNPTSLNVKRTVKWQTDESLDGALGSQTYLGGQQQDLSLRLLFHAEDGRKAADVARAIKECYALLETRTKAGDGSPLKRARPPIVELVWGSYRSDAAVVVSVDVTTELFDLDGAPLRAWVGLTLSRTLDDAEKKAKKPTNPTTRATNDRRAHVVAAGEDIALIAHHQYGDPTRWSEIATANELDDPLRVHPTQLLLIPVEER